MTKVFDDATRAGCAAEQVGPGPGTEIVATAAVTRGPADDPRGPVRSRDYDLPGFVESRFSPLVHEAAQLCLGKPGASHADDWRESTAMLLVGTFGDAVTADTASTRLLAGLVHNPLLFYQSVPTSVLGHLAREYGITGEISCLSVDRDVCAPALAAAELILHDGDMRQVLVIGVELAATPRTAPAYRSAQLPYLTAPRHDVAAAVLLRSTDPTVPTVDRTPAGLPAPVEFGSLNELVRLCTGASRRVPAATPPATKEN
ncbi:hypothetical protein OG989_16550 [Micromonospora sp. NBC_01740]|uniref:hypothetical protein n=1 Tax=Micromonospora sp. NBC_01740 TaxID=2975986 RepID=UPI002E122ADF|nr:hypothetical protein OG989_16550 [Micromonospora sp. NBC_01740]